MSRSAKRRVQSPVSHRVRPVDFSDLPLLFPGHARLQHNTVWHHSQAVRQRSAKSPFSSSILDGASKKQARPPYGACLLFWLRQEQNRTGFDLWMVPSFLHPSYGVYMFFGKETAGIEPGSISGWCPQKPPESSRVRSLDGGHCCSCPLQPRGNCFTAYNTDKIYNTFSIKSIISYCTFESNVV